MRHFRPLRIAILGAALLLAAPSLAQPGISRQSVPRYQPSTPTTSPYLNLLRTGGGVPNYYTLVRPLQRQANFQQQVMQAERRQNIVNRELEQQLAQPALIRPTGSAGWYMDEGVTSPYGNTGNYYNQTDFRAVSRRR